MNDFIFSAATGKPHARVEAEFTPNAVRFHITTVSRSTFAHTRASVSHAQMKELVRDWLATRSKEEQYDALAYFQELAQNEEEEASNG